MSSIVYWSVCIVSSIVLLFTKEFGIEHDYLRSCCWRTVVGVYKEGQFFLYVGSWLMVSETFHNDEF